MSNATSTKASSFAVTCNLLSQYIKQNGPSLGDLASREILELFPQRSGFGLQTPPAADKREPEKSQLTMFYKGKVLVFDNFPADKARDLMLLAGKGCGAAKNAGFAPNPTTVPSATLAEPPRVSSACPPKPIVSDLPIARKASLHRFLEKRKDRISAKAPYQASKGKDSPASAVAPKMEENQPWLGINTVCHL